MELEERPSILVRNNQRCTLPQYTCSLTFAVYMYSTMTHLRDRIKDFVAREPYFCGRENFSQIIPPKLQNVSWKLHC